MKARTILSGTDETSAVKPCQPKAKTSRRRYTEDELTELYELHCKLVEKHVFNYESGALWQRKHGAAADLEASLLLRMTDDALGLHGFELRPEDAAYMLKKIGAHVAHLIQHNKAEDFEQLACILRARKEGRPLDSITAKELRIKRTRGRKPKTSDLSRAVPLALMEVTRKRSRDHALQSFTDAKITRQELRVAIQDQQAAALQEAPPRISEFELSRWITKFEFQKYMAEQPVARKAPKSC